MRASPQTVRDWTVAEIQGLYGPFTFSERLLQKIWLRGEFDTMRAALEDGRAVRVIHPGRWNLLGGPDFRDARLALGGLERTGDVELHLHAEDWLEHEHEADPAYARVILHVVLFPPGGGCRPCRIDGQPLPTLVLLPLLLHDLEEYAADDAVELLANRTDWTAIEQLAGLPADQMRNLLHETAGKRWTQKVDFARRRVDRLGWPGACHHAALEILGYRFNRVPMLRTAVRAPLESWATGAADVGALFAAESSWSVQGVRPANHPRERLRQYRAWVLARPDWPVRLVVRAARHPHPGAGAGTPCLRKACGLHALRSLLAESISAGAICGTRFDNLVCDGFLPLLAARTRRNFFPLWHHWFAGDVPPRIRDGLKALAVFDGRSQPACHGLVQGLLGWLLAREREREAAAGAAAPRPPGAHAARPET